MPAKADYFVCFLCKTEKTLHRSGYCTKCRRGTCERCGKGFKRITNQFTKASLCAKCRANKRKPKFLESMIYH